MREADKPPCCGAREPRQAAECGPLGRIGVGIRAVKRSTLGERIAYMALSPKGLPQSIWNGTTRIQAEIYCYHLEVSENRIWAPRVS